MSRKQKVAAIIVAALVAGVVAFAAQSTGAAPRRVISVTSLGQLRTAVSHAQPGDRIELADGSYSNGSTIALTRSGTATAPITIAAAHTGKAEIKGSAGFSFGAVSHVAVSGFRFTHRSTISVPSSADHVRLSRNLIQLSGDRNWVTVSCDDCEVDHNTFRHKTTQGVFLQVGGPGSHGMARRVRIHHNYFFDHSFGGSNGGESIRLGLSSRQHGSARAVVEHNLFERANGDSEAISVKSSDNTVRYNTIRNSRGQITLRHGNRTRVDGNIILGGRSGIRFFGNDHVIVNNLIEGTSGQPIQVGSGEIRDDTDSTTAHEAADRGLVAFNTVVCTRSNLIALGPDNHEFAPDDTTVANNVLVGGPGKLVTVRKGTHNHWQGNIVWGGWGGDMPASGFRSVDPALAIAGGLHRLRAGSPAVDAAAGSYPQVTADFDRQSRSGPKDAGADEHVPTAAPRRPLSPTDVGPLAP
jgi:Chondroitinase B